jgi:hypothetical protein
MPPGQYPIAVNKYLQHHRHQPPHMMYTRTTLPLPLPLPTQRSIPFKIH